MSLEAFTVSEIGLADPRHISAAVDFYNDFRHDNKIVGQWMWEYWTYHAEKSVFLVAKDGNRIIGNQAAIPIHLNVAGCRWLTGKYENALLDPAYRGTTTYTDLSNAAVALCVTRGMACIWGFTSASRVFEKAGFRVWESVVAQPVAALSIPAAMRASQSRPQKAPGRLPSTVPTLAFAVYSVGRQRLARQGRSRRTAGVVLERTPRSFDDVRDLYRRLRIEHPETIHVDLDEEYLAWRVSNNPNVSHSMVWAYEADKLQGYCLATWSDGNVGLIADLTFDTEAAGETCLCAALDAMRSGRCAFADYLGNRDNALSARAMRLLSRYGFVRRKPGTFIALNVSTLENDHFYDIRNWYLTGLWTEGYR